MRKLKKASNVVSGVAKPAERILGQVRFKQQHWWNGQPWKERFANKETTPIDVQKAAMIYEAARRRPEVRRAWLVGKTVPGDNTHFTGMVVKHLLLSWVELDEITRKHIMEAIQSPWFVPPKGYSTFPHKSFPNKCRKAAMQVLHLPKSSATPNGAKSFVDYARRFEDAGFTIVAVDNKTKQAVRHACEAIEALPRSIRKADRGQEWIIHLPPDISRVDEQAMKSKIQQGTCTKQDLNELWRKYSKPVDDLNQVPGQPQWKPVAEVRPVAMHKRQREESVVEEKLFNFAELCREIERVDSGLMPIGDFIERLRL